MTWTSSEHELAGGSYPASRVTIDLPARYDPDGDFPLILCLDGPWIAGTVRDATRIMSMSGEAPEAVVVGIGFDRASMSELLRDRARWFTPTPWVPPPETGVSGVAADELGKAQAYRSFLRDVVLPFVDGVAPHGERWLVGHSFGGLFGVLCLLEEPELFSRYLLASPSIWWNDRAILDVENDGAADRNPAASVFLSAGDRELPEDREDEYRMRLNMLELAERLRSRGYADLSISTAVLPDESHNSTIGAAISRGLRYLVRST